MSKLLVDDKINSPVIFSVLALIITLVVAEISYRLVERPFITFGAKVAERWKTTDLFPNKLKPIASAVEINK